MDTGRTVVREGERGYHTLPPVHREGVNSHKVVQENEERGGEIRTETGKLYKIIEGEGRCIIS